MPVLPAGFVRKDGAKVRLYLVEALARLRSKSCIIDGEAVACDGNGMPTFDRIRYRGHDGSVFAFELIELNGDDLGTDPLESRKATLANVLAKVVGERPSLERGIGRSRFSRGIQRMAALASCSELNKHGSGGMVVFPKAARSKRGE
jgi:ATP-dependent DNA ligase